MSRRDEERERTDAAIDKYGASCERYGLLKGLAIAERIAVWCAGTNKGEPLPASAVYSWAKAAIDRARMDAGLPPLKWEE